MAESDATSILTERDLQRYNRQMMIDGFGRDGQAKLKRARVFVAGAGGLGSPVSTYLAVAGVGHIRIVDRDVVEISNLNRQILHWDKDIGRKKAESAGEKLSALNGDIEVEAIVANIGADNVFDLVAGCDVIVDAMDNFPTRYLLNRAAIVNRVPFIHGGIYGMGGLVTTVVPGQTPCLRCLFPESPPPSVFPVIGVAPATIAVLQAAEVIKCLVGIGRLLTNRLLIFDGLTMEFRTFTTRWSESCPDCGDVPRNG